MYCDHTETIANLRTERDAYELKCRQWSFACLYLGVWLAVAVFAVAMLVAVLSGF